MYFNQLNILTLLIILPVGKCDCTNKLFFLENPSYQPQKGEIRIRNPGYYWKQKVINYGYGKEIYEKLDESKYDYMFHSYHSGFGLEVYRICHKNSEFTKYGKVETHLDRGYLLETPDIMKVDSYLFRNKFNIKRKTYLEMENYIRKQKEERDKQYAEEHPYMAALNTIVTNVINFIIYLLITSPFMYIICWAFIKV